MSPFYAYLVDSPLHAAGAVISVYASAIVIEGICAKSGWVRTARNHPWDVIVLGTAGSVLMGCAAARALW